jgi:dolichyldiphosphatase
VCKSTQESNLGVENPRIVLKGMDRNNGGSISAFNVIGSTSKFLVSGLAAVILLTSKGKASWIPTYYIFGAILSGIFSKFLKITIKEPRPEGSSRGGYGMPSSHTQSFFFFLTAVGLNIQRLLPQLYGSILVATMGAYAIAASCWRVHTKIHSLAQILVGAALGISSGILACRFEDVMISADRLSLLPETMPVIVRVTVAVVGAFVVAKKEIKTVIKLAKSHLNKKD